MMFNGMSSLLVDDVGTERFRWNDLSLTIERMAYPSLDLQVHSKDRCLVSLLLVILST